MKLSALIRSLRQFYFNNPIYTWRLNRVEAREIKIPVFDSWPGEIEVGRDIINGKIVGLKLSNDQSVWEIKPIDPLSFEALHGLLGFDILELKVARRAPKVRKLVSDWLDAFDVWHPVVYVEIF